MSLYFLPQEVIASLPGTVQPPTHLRGYQTCNSFEDQVDVINNVKWNAPTRGPKPTCYEIYSDFTCYHLIAKVSAHEKKYSDHNRAKHETYSYYVVSVDNLGNRSLAVGIIFKGGKTHLARHELVSIQVSPANAQIEPGLLRQYKAIATYADGTTEDVTSRVNWISSKKKVAVISSSGLISSLKPGHTVIKASFGRIKGHAKLTVLDAQLTDVSISPATNNLVIHESQQLIAVGTYSNGVTIDSDHGLNVMWNSSNTSVVSVNQVGLLEATGSGSASVTATSVINSAVSGSATVAVSSVTLDSITIQPSTATTNIYDNVSFIAIGHYSDGSTKDSKHGFKVIWNVSDSNVATIDSTGTATAIKESATTQVTATAGSTVGTATLNVNAAVLTSIVITPASIQLHKGEQDVLVAKGVYNDGSTIDVTKSAVWSSSNSSIATISNVAGYAIVTAISPGSTTITATLGNMKGNSSVTVSTAIITSIVISPSSVILVQGDEQPFTAKAYYNNGSFADVTQSVTWESLNESIVTVSDAVGSKGLAKAKASPGSTIITATIGNVTGNANVNVAATLTRVTLNPDSSTLIVGQKQAITAIATYSDGTTKDVTALASWLSSNNGVGVTAGVAVALKPNVRAQITAKISGLTSQNEATINVTEDGITSIAIQPPSLTLATGETSQLKAIATFSTGATSDVTDLVSWVSDNYSLVSVNNLGLVTVVNAGQTLSQAHIYAVCLGVTSNVCTVTVNPVKIVSISLSPVSSNLYVGQTVSIKATATYIDGSTRDITETALWSVVSGGGVKILAKGLIEAVAVNQTAGIVASLQNINSEPASIQINSSPVVGIAITPHSISVPSGLQQQFIAIATYADNTTADVTQMANWSSENPSVATISDIIGSKGLATGHNQGSTTITAAFSGYTSSADLEVTAVVTKITINPTNVSLHVGQTQTFKAVATLSDGSTQDVTQTANWKSSNQKLVQIIGQGFVWANIFSSSGGISIVSAQFENVIGNANVTVSSAEIASQTLWPANAYIQVNGFVTYTSNIVYSDGFSLDSNNGLMPDWYAVDVIGSDVAFINFISGKLQGNNQGEAYAGTGMGINYSTVQVYSQPIIESMTITPSATTLKVGNSIQFECDVAYKTGSKQSTRDGTLNVISWNIYNPALASINSSGFATGSAAGNAIVTLNFSAPSFLGGNTYTVQTTLVITE